MILLSAICVLPKRLNDALKERGFIEPLQENFETKQEAIDYAIGRITEPLNSESPREYGVILDYDDYDVVSECLGDESSVNCYPIKYLVADKLGIKHPYILLHGHPEREYRGRYGTRSFSIQDFKTFAFDDNEMESYVVNKKGQFCLFRKKEGFIKPTEEELLKLEKELDTVVHYSWPNPVKVYKDGEVIHKVNDFQAIHAFWKKVADKYGFEYYTNFGTFDGEDAYIDYYYPEQNPPEAPTSHRHFKL